MLTSHPQTNYFLSTPPTMTVPGPQLFSLATAQHQQVSGDSWSVPAQTAWERPACPAPQGRSCSNYHLLCPQPLPNLINLPRALSWELS